MFCVIYSADVPNMFCFLLLFFIFVNIMQVKSSVFIKPISYDNVLQNENIVYKSCIIYIYIYKNIQDKRYLIYIYIYITIFRMTTYDAISKQKGRIKFKKRYYYYCPKGMTGVNRKSKFYFTFL